MIINPEPMRIERTCLDGMNIIKIPIYSSEDVPENYCARYARLCAEVSFGKIYPISNAWTLHDKSGIIVKKVDNDKFKEMANSGIIEPGTLVGVHFEGSDYNRIDRNYTHMATYAGQQFGAPAFLEQVGSVIRLSDLLEYDDCGMEIREIICLK